MTSRTLSLLALFVALSVVGSFIKIPALVGSVALDLFPALMAAVYLGRNVGATVAVLGHFVSAFIAGMPLGPLHVVVAIEMALIVYLFQMIYERGKTKIAGLFVVFANGLLAPIPMIFFFGVAFYIGLLPSLLIGAALNTIVGLLLIPRLQHVFERVAL